MKKSLASATPNDLGTTKEHSKPPGQVLIATIGTSPQVGTRTLDELLEKKYLISDVVWIHSWDHRDEVQKALARVHHEVNTYYQQTHPDIRFHFVPIEDKHQFEPSATHTREDVEAVLFTLHRQLCRWKDKGYTAHLSISGGPKVLAAFGVAAAQLTFDSDKDKCWHLIPPHPGADREAMHATDRNPETETLIPIPVLRWKTWKEWASRSLAEAIAHDPLHAQVVTAELNKEEMFQWRLDFAKHVLSASDARVLRLLALHGWENEEIDRVIPGKCKNTIGRIWDQYCDAFVKKYKSSSPDFKEDLKDDLEAMNHKRLRRSRLVADFHIVFRKLDEENKQKGGT